MNYAVLVEVKYNAREDENAVKALEAIGFETELTENEDGEIKKKLSWGTEMISLKEFIDNYMYLDAPLKIKEL